MVDLTREAVDDTAQVCVARFGFRDMPRRVEQTPQIEQHEEQQESQKTSSRTRFYRFIRIKSQNACLVNYFSTNRMQINSNEKLLAENHEIFPVEIGPKVNCLCSRKLGQKKPVSIVCFSDWIVNSYPSFRPSDRISSFCVFSGDVCGK